MPMNSSVNNKCDIPESLYHYTNVDVLALILKHRTLRLNSLTNMDDRQEQASKDNQNFGRFVFVSSWTDSEREEIPMWKMYTPPHCGVRIRMKVNPFKLYPGFENTMGVLPLLEPLNQDYFLSNNRVDKILTRVTYTDDNDLLVPQVIFNDTDNQRVHVNLDKVGIYKNTYWKFQREWRYRLCFYPFSLGKAINQSFSKTQQGMPKEINTLIQNMIDGTSSMPFTYYDLQLADDAFDNMEITLSPDISESSKIFVHLLLEKYAPNCRVRESKLKDLL